MALSPFIDLPNLQKNQIRRVVVTGMGAISPLGNSLAEITSSLQQGKSGITTIPEYIEQGMRCHIGGLCDFDPSESIPRKDIRFMGKTSAYTYDSSKQAIAHADLPEDLINSPRFAVIGGQGSPSMGSYIGAWEKFKDGGVKKVLPYMVSRTMGSAAGASVSTLLKTLGPSYTISSACATSAHSIGHGAELIAMNKADFVLAGGGDEQHISVSMLFDAMKALSSNYNDNPTIASRPFDRDRDGFVPGEGSAMLLLEEYEHAVKRGAKIYAELAGYGASSDGHDHVQPSGEGAYRAMIQAMKCIDKNEVQYINAHGTSTPVGDIKEIEVITKLFEGNIPLVSSTKALTGHALGGAGALEALYTILMLDNNFVVPCHNLHTPDEEMNNFPFPRELQQKELTCCLSNSFGFGGTNASLLFKKI